jgi:hypothetical protein
MINWFPLPRSLMESPSFVLSTPVEKLLLLHVASELNLRGPFYKADLETAVTLGISEDKVRRSRRAFMRLGWIQAVPGFRCKGRHLATRYLAIPGAERKDDDFWAPLHRYAFEALLSQARARTLTHADLVVYVYLTYLRHRCQGERDDFFVTKHELRDMTGLANATTCVDHLYSGFVFTGDSHLFECQDEYHRLRFRKWASFLDPSEGGNNAQHAQHYRAEIAAKVEAIRHPKYKRPVQRRAASRV